MTLVAANPQATIKVNGDEVESGEASKLIRLDEMPTTIITVEVSFSGAPIPNIYTITIRSPGIRIRAKVFLEGPLQ